MDEMQAYFFSAGYYNESGQVTNLCSGVITTSTSPFEPSFYDEILSKVANAMNPPRPKERISIRSLSLLASG